MKKYLFILLLLIISCNNEPSQCNCQIIGNDHLREVIDEGGIQIIHSSLPIIITPYDTIIDCNQNGIDWYKITEDVSPPRTITKTSYRKIQCN